MLDVSAAVGRGACAELQKSFSKESVMFVETNVTREEELVGGWLQWLSVS